MRSMLLHVCCPTCTAGTYGQLADDYNLTCYFDNPNIHPFSEYKARLDGVRAFCEKRRVPIIEGDYDTKAWFRAVGAGREDEPEGGARCRMCFMFRLLRAAQYAKENGFEVFATTLTMGRNKEASVLNPIGKAAAHKFGLQFYEADFKKNGGQETARRIVTEENLYRQKYCGCIYSKRKLGS